MTTLIGYLARLKDGGKHGLVPWIRASCGEISDKPIDLIAVGDFTGDVMSKVVCFAFLKQIALRSIREERLVRILTCFDDHLSKQLKQSIDPIDAAKCFVHEHAHCRCRPLGAADSRPSISERWIFRAVLDWDILTWVIGDESGMPIGPRPDSISSSLVLKRHLELHKKLGKPLKFRSDLPLFWFTLTSEVDDSITGSAGGTSAEKIRDLLGLYRYAYVTGPLTGIVFQADEVRINHKTPTVFDAALSPYFGPTNEQDSWGRSLQLPTLEKGAREAIADETEWPMNSDHIPLGLLGPCNLPKQPDWHRHCATLWSDMMMISPGICTELVGLLERSYYGG